MENYIWKDFIQLWLNLASDIQINQNHRFFHFSTIKLFVLIISNNISGNIPTVIINQLSDAIPDKENYISSDYE